MRIEKKTLKSKIRSWKSKIGGRCFLPKSSLPPGHNQRHPGNVNPPLAAPPVAIMKFRVFSPIDWVIWEDFPAGPGIPCREGMGPDPRGASRPWQDIMRRWFFHGFASEYIQVGPIRSTIRFSPKGSGTDALRKPGNHSGIRRFSRRCCPAMGGTHPLGLGDRTFTVPFQPTQLGEDPKFIYLGRPE
jgi:hypothetical protein